MGNRSVSFRKWCDVCATNIFLTSNLAGPNCWEDIKSPKILRKLGEFMEILWKLVRKYYALKQTLNHKKYMKFH